MPYSFSSCYHTPSSLFIHHSFIQTISTAFTTSLSFVIPLLFLLIPISRTLMPQFLSQWVQAHCALHHVHSEHSFANTLDFLASTEGNRMNKRREKYNMLGQRVKGRIYQRQFTVHQKSCFSWHRTELLLGSHCLIKNYIFQHALPRSQWFQAEPYG